MKISNSFALLFMLTILTSCNNAHLKNLNNGKQIDNRLVGVWTGSEKDNQFAGVQKDWEMKRNDDGSFQLIFKITQDGNIDSTFETGNWWVKNGKFYEYHDFSSKTDFYKYSVLNEDQVKFNAIEIRVDMNSDSYEFIDTRKK